MSTTPTTPTTNSPAFNPAAFEQTAFWTKPRLLPEIGKKYYFKILSGIYEAPEQIKTRNTTGEAKKPMMLCNVFNYEDRHQYQLILSHTLLETFKSKGDAFIGKTFMVSKTKMVDGKGGQKYAAFDVVEGKITGVDTPDVDPVAPAQTPAPAPVAPSKDDDEDTKPTAPAPAKVAPIAAAPASTGKTVQQTNAKPAQRK